MKLAAKLILNALATFGSLMILWSIYSSVLTSKRWVFYKALAGYEEIESFGFIANKGHVDAKIWLGDDKLIYFGDGDYVNSLVRSDMTFVYQIGPYDLHCDGGWPSLYGLSILLGLKGEIAVGDLITQYDKIQGQLAEWPTSRATGFGYKIDVNDYREFYPGTKEGYSATSCWAEVTPVFPNTMYPRENGEFRGYNYYYFRGLK